MAVSKLSMGGLVALAMAAVASAQDDTCRPAMEVEIATSSYVPQEPALPGVMPGIERPKLILAQDIDWPPYAFLGVPPESDFQVAGFGHDVALGIGELCDIDVTVMQTDWEKCWNAGKIGESLLAGHYHACSTYTHTVGERNRFMEFSGAILESNKPAGLLTRLENGAPVVDGVSGLAGKKVVDVVGWAPTSDTLAVVENKCTGGNFADFEMLTPTIPDGANPNDVALQMLLNGDADAMWVYADQAHTYKCDDDGVTPEWDCDLWAGFGSTFAYVQTGLFGHVYNGTTLAMAKKGSGVKQLVDSCLPKFMETKEYYDICVKHGLQDSCFHNSHFPEVSTTVKTWEKSTKELTTTCADGYCPCPST